MFSDDEVTEIDPMTRNIALQRDKAQAESTYLREVLNVVGSAMSELMQDMVSQGIDVDRVQKTWENAVQAHEQWLDSLSE